MPTEPLTVAQALAALGVTGILAFVVIMFQTGKLRRESELTDADRDHATDIAFREALRLEAIFDRKAADERLAKLVEALRENNDLTRSALALNERLIDEFVRPSSERTRRTDRARTDRQ